MAGETLRFTENVLGSFATAVLERLGAPSATAELAVRSLLDASLLGIDTHGIGSLEMYVLHLRKGGVRADAEPRLVSSKGSLELWDMEHGLGLASTRKIMTHVVEQAGRLGICLATCRNANHLGACGVYGKMAADAGLIGIVSQQTLASLAPWGGTERRIGASPLAIVAPIDGAFPYYFDASMGMMTRSQIKEAMRAGRRLPEGMALDSEGTPTTDPREAWKGQILPIGRHKGVGLAMSLEILQAILSGNQLSMAIPSIVDEPSRSADTSLFVMAMDPDAISSRGSFANRMKEFVAYCESSPARNPAEPPRYPGRREGETWKERRRDGIPVSPALLGRFDSIASTLGLDRLELRRLDDTRSVSVS